MDINFFTRVEQFKYITGCVSTWKFPSNKGASECQIFQVVQVQVYLIPQHTIFY